jgi:hypothetical protein
MLTTKTISTAIAILGALAAVIPAAPEPVHAASSAGPTVSGSDVEMASTCGGPADKRRRQGTCIEQVRARRGTHCGSEDSAEIRVRNRCNARVYVRLCLGRSDGSRDCGEFGLNAGSEHTSWTCHSNGRWGHDAVFSSKPAKDFVCADWN